jgi:hypothetical protein
LPKKSTRSAEVAEQIRRPDQNAKQKNPNPAQKHWQGKLRGQMAIGLNDGQMDAGEKNHHQVGKPK